PGRPAPRRGRRPLRLGKWGPAGRWRRRPGRGPRRGRRGPGRPLRGLGALRVAALHGGHCAPGPPADPRRPRALAVTRIAAAHGRGAVRSPPPPPPRPPPTMAPDMTVQPLRLLPAEDPPPRRR